MKNRKFARVLSLTLSVFVAVGMLVVFTEKPEASSKYQYSISNPLHVGEEGWADAYVYPSGKPLSAKSLTSSNKKVLKAKKSWYYNENHKKVTYYYMIGVAPGTSKVTFKYKLPNGKVKTTVKNVTVLAYPEQIENLSINGKNIKITKDNRYFYNAKCKKKSAAIAMKLKEGWKIDSASGWLYSSKSGKEKKVKGVKSLVKNGKKISFPKGYSTLSVNLHMTNGVENINYNISLYR